METATFVAIFISCLLISFTSYALFTAFGKRWFGSSSQAAGHRWKDVQQVNDSLDRVGKPSDPPTIQVLFFHGLPSEDFSNVHLATWENGDGLLWPHTWLLEEFPGAHIFFVKYSAALENVRFHINNIGENLTSDLLQATIGQVTGCPVVLVGHCIGGLIIKNLCLKMDKELRSPVPSMNKKAKNFLDSMRGIFYYSTPHDGIAEITKASYLRDHPLFKYCEVLSRNTAVLNSEFSNLCKQYPQWKIEGVGESLPVKVGVFKNVLVVEEASARQEVQIFKTLSEDHFSICKPTEKTSGGFYQLKYFLQNMEMEHTLREDNQYLPDSIVGMEIPMQEVKERLKDVSTLVLTGMGGLGKTTLAKKIFNELGCKYEYTCFVLDVKFISGTADSLKEEVWKRLHQNGKKVSGTMNWSELRGKRLLLILDDISHERDASVLSEIAQGPAVESRFIATSRSKDLLDHFYNIPFLGEMSAKELFMGFMLRDKEILSPELASLVERIVRKCDGLPLTLEVLGKYLKRKRNKEDWEQTLNALCAADAISNLNERLWAKLRPSIDNLEENEKQMFLDATTFFHERRTYSFLQFDLRIAQTAWREAYGNKERLLWQTLVDRSLVDDVKEDHECIRVHEQLLSLGRKIASEPCNGRVMELSAAFRLLISTNEIEKKNICALSLCGEPRDWKTKKLLQSLAAEANLKQNAFVDGKVDIACLGLERLEKLKYLEVDSDIVIDRGGEGNWFPNSLVVLFWRGFRISNLAHLSRLAILAVSFQSSDDQANYPEELSFPICLGPLPALRILILGDGTFESISEEIGELRELEEFRVKNCRNLQTLPKRLGELSKLKLIQVTECSSLLTLPDSFGNLSALESLNFHQCAIRTLPESIGKLSSLRSLAIVGSDNLESLPESIGQLSSLRSLRIHSCHNLNSLPKSLELLTALDRLNIRSCINLKLLPETLGRLTALRKLTLQNLDSLQSLPESVGQLAKLEVLRIENMNELDILPDSLANLGSLRELHLERLWSLKSIPDWIPNLPSLQTLELGILPYVRELPSWLGETGGGHLTVTRKVFWKTNHHFTFGGDQGRIYEWEFIRIHSVAIAHVRTSDYARALVLLEIDSFEEPQLDGFVLQEKGIVKRMMGDLDGALEDLTAALECYSKIEERHHHYTYDCWKHRGYVKFLMGDMEGAESDGTMALKLQLVYRGSWSSQVFYRTKLPHFSLGDEVVEYLHFHLEGGHDRQAVDKYENLLWSSHPVVMEKVRASDFQGAVATFTRISARMLSYKTRGFFLQEMGILKRMVCDLDGALEDLTAALEWYPKDYYDYHNFYEDRSYDCYKHRGYVKFLLGDHEGARVDAEKCLTLARTLDRTESVWVDLGETPVSFLDFNLL